MGNTVTLPHRYPAFMFSLKTGTIWSLLMFGILSLQCSSSDKDETATQHVSILTGDVSEAGSEIIKLEDSTSLSAGGSTYNIFCVQCHGALGEGLIGPNLTDPYWLHGNSVTDVIRIIKNGVPEQGMLSWHNILSTLEIQQVASYVLNLGGSQPAHSKGPEGKMYSSDGLVLNDSLVMTVAFDRQLAGLPLKGDVVRGQKLFNGTYGCAHCHAPDIMSLADNRDLKRMGKRYGPGAGLVFDLVTKEGRNGTAMPPWSHVSPEDLIDMKTFIFSNQIME